MGLGAVSGLLQRPGGDRRCQRDQRQLAHSSLGSPPHLLPPIVANNLGAMVGALWVIAVAG
jgi:hypothetical protein